MIRQISLAVIGSGPAGLAAASAAAQCGVEVALIDEQKAAGGQIYRGITRTGQTLENILGADYSHGRSLIEALQQPTVQHISGATVWQMTRQREIYFSQNNHSQMLNADHIILATGATERAMPFPGWTLPGVITAGGGQILLKTAGLIPGSHPIVLAGSGPLLFLVAAQYLRAGVKITALLETTPRDRYRRALRYLPAAVKAGYLGKGLALLKEIKKHGISHYKGVNKLQANGDERLQTLHFVCNGRAHEIPCSTLLVHNGVVPNVQISRSLDLSHDWDALQRCWRPRLDQHGATEIDGISIAGDGAGISGAKAAEYAGRIAGLHAAQRLGVIDADAFQTRSKDDRRLLQRELAARPFLDTLYAPTAEFLAPSDETLVCRCEEVTAGQIREYVRLGCLGPNQVKSFGRCGMGPCQGRFCGLTVAEVIAEARGQPMQEIGYYRIRPPLKPITLGELAAIADSDEEQHSE